MTKKLFAAMLTVLIVGLFVISSCATQPTETKHDSVLTEASLTTSLLGAGASITEGNKVEQSFFSPKGKILSVNGQDIQVYEYKAEDEAQKDASRITDGSSFTTPDGVQMVIDWISEPHFYQKGRIIVLYVGNDKETLSLLQNTLGSQINPNWPDAGEEGTSPYQSLIRTRVGDLTLHYADGKAILSGTLERANPCVNWKITSRVMERFPEQVVFEINDISTAEMCVAMVGEPQEVEESVGVSEQASFRVMFEGEEVFSGQLGSEGTLGSQGKGSAAGKTSPADATCCRQFNEGSGEDKYFWSDTKTCGIPPDTLCAGSCPTPVEDRSPCETPYS